MINAPIEILDGIGHKFPFDYQNIFSDCFCFVSDEEAKEVTGQVRQPMVEKTTFSYIYYHFQMYAPVVYDSRVLAH